MSLLQSQLQKLQQSLPQTQISSTRDASFLFPKSEQLPSASLRVMVLKALNSLSRVNPDFQHFVFLFSEQSLDMDRGLLPTSENASIKASLEAFMMLLSPHFLLRPAQLCLEYLVRMYNVHLFETDSLMKCIIPFHETLPFVSIVRILHLTENSPFSWLHTIQEKRAVVTREFIVNVSRSNFALLEWIGLTALQYAEKGIPHRVMHSFFCAMYLDYFDKVGVDEIGLKRMLSIVVRGLTNTEIVSSEFHRACIMVLIQALSLMDMKEEPLLILLRDVVVACLDTNRLRDALTICIYAYQAQGLNEVPLELMPRFFPLQDNERAPLFSELRQISEQYVVENFACALAQTQFSVCLRACRDGDDSMHDDKSAQHKEEREIALLKSMLHQLPQLDAFIRNSIPALFFHASQSESITQKLIPIVPVMDARFPKAVDEAMENIHAIHTHSPFYKTFLSVTQQTRASVERNVQSKLMSDIQNRNVDVRLKVIAEIDATLGKRDASPLFKDFTAKLLLNKMSAQDLALVEAVASMKHLQEAVTADRFLVRVREVIEDLTEEMQLDNDRVVSALKACFQRLIIMIPPSDASSIERIAMLTFFVLSSELPSAHEALYQCVACSEHPLFAKVSKDNATSASQRIIHAVAKNLSHIPTLHSLMLKTARSSFKMSLLVLSTMLHATRHCADDVALTYLHEALSLVMTMHQCATKSPRSMPKLNALDADTTEFSLTPINYASYTVEHALQFIGQKFPNISMDELLKAHTPHTSPLSSVVNQLTTLVFSTSYFDAFSYVELLLQVLNENAPAYLATYLTTQQEETRMIQIVRILCFIVEDQKGVASFMSLLPPLICVLGLVTTTRAVKSAILDLIQLASNSSRSRGVLYNPMGLELPPTGSFIKLCTSLLKTGEPPSGATQDMCTFRDYSGPHADVAKFLVSFMKSFNNGKVQLRLLSQLIKYDFSRDISHALVESLLLPMLKQVNSNEPFDTAEKMTVLGDIIKYLIDVHISRKDVNEKETKLFLRLMAMTRQPGCAERLASTTIVEAFSPSFIFGTLLKEKHVKQFFAEMSSDNKLKFALIVSNILSTEEKGSPLTLAYVDIIQAAQLDVSTVLALFTKATTLEAQIDLLEMFVLTSVQPHPRIISKIFDLMKAYRTGETKLASGKSEKMIDFDDDLSSDSENDAEDSDSDSSDDSSDSDSSDSDSSDEESDASAEKRVKKVISLEDSLFFVTCFNVLHSMISRVAQGLEKNPDDTILEQCSESFDLEETMKILSKSNHPQLFHSSMLCVDAMAQIFPSRMLNYVSKIVKIISGSFKENNVTAIEMSEKLMVRLLPHLTQNADDVFPFLNMLINSFQSIPDYRRLRLYTTLLKSISRKYTFSLIVLFLEKYIEDSQPMYRDFCFELLDYFNAEKQCYCLEQMANFIASITREPTEALQIRSNALFGISSAKSGRSEEFIAQTVIALAEFAQNYISQDSFLRRITESLASIEEEDTRQEYNAVLQQYLFDIAALFIATMTDAKYLQFEKKKPAPGARTTLIHHLRSDRLYKLSMDAFTVIQQIMDAKSNANMYSSLIHLGSKLYTELLGESKDDKRNTRIQGKAVDLLNLLLADMSYENSEFLLTNSALYSKLAKTISRRVLRKDNIPERNLQLCLISVDQLARRFAHLHESYFAPLVPLIVDKMRQANNMFMEASCALALASICSTPLKKQSDQEEKFVTREIFDQIPFAFEAVVETVLKALNNSEHNNKTLALYLNGMLSSLAHMVKYCGMYASPYLNGIIDILLHVSMSASTTEQVQALVHTIVEGLTTHLSVPVLIRPLFQALSTARRIGSKSVSTLFGILSTIFSTMTSPDATQISEKVIKFFTQAFDTRSENSESKFVNIDDMNAIEGEMIESFKLYVLKLEDIQFASIVKELQKWATSGVEQNPMRLRTYYRVVAMFSATLKVLFVPYWSNIINQTLDHLKSTISAPTAEKKRKRDKTVDLQDDMHHLSIHIFDALRDLCTYDDKGDVTRDDELLKRIYQTLIDHLLNLACGTLDDYTERVEHLVPALIELTKIAPQKEWNPIQKTIAQQVTAVLNMDLSSAQKSKYLSSVVSTLHAVYAETPNFVTQVADILPTVSELLEENDPLVQQELSSFIQFLQKESGEDIREYLSRA